MSSSKAVGIAGVFAAVCCLASPAGAVIIAYTGTGALSGGASGNLNIGRQFSVTGTGITVRDVGVWDNNDDGLANSHTVTLFSIIAGAGTGTATVTPITGGSATVSSGTAATLDTGMRFTSLATPLFLAAGNYSVIAYGTNASGGDPYGDGGAFPSGANVSDIRFDPFEFTPATSPTYPNGGDSGNHSSASFRYDIGNTVPEPASIVLFGLGAGSLFLATRRRKA